MLPDFDALRAAGEARLYPDKIKITVGMATCGRAAGAEAVYETLQQRIEQRGLDVILASTGCIGYCQGEPLVDVRLPGAGRVLYRDMTRPRARALDRLPLRPRVALPADGAWVVIDAGSVARSTVPRAALCTRPPGPGRRRLRTLQRPSSRASRRSSCATAASSTRPAWPRYVARGGYRGLARTLRRLCAPAGHRRGEPLGAARAGRRRLPHGPQVADRGGRAGRREVHHLQRRRGRSRARTWIAPCWKATRTASSRG